jgi:hypothetical protein
VYITEEKENYSPYTKELRKKLAVRLNGGKKYFIVDSMPLEICKNARITRSKICKDQEGAFPNQGFCASQNARYYGYKLHGGLLGRWFK